MTPIWLDVCLDLRKALVPIPPERVECQPLPYTLPIEGMSGVTCAYAPSIAKP